MESCCFRKALKCAVYSCRYFYPVVGGGITATNSGEGGRKFSDRHHQKVKHKMYKQYSLHAISEVAIEKSNLETFLYVTVLFVALKMFKKIPLSFILSIIFMLLLLKYVSSFVFISF